MKLARIILAGAVCCAMSAPVLAKETNAGAFVVLGWNEATLVVDGDDRKERRDERGRADERRDRRDCRQEEGRVGKDKRDCKQEEVRDGVRGRKDDDEDKGEES